MKKRVVIASGGTGGHLFPALRLAKDLSSTYEVLMVGGGLESSSFLESTNLIKYSINAYPWLGPKKALKFFYGNLQGLFSSWKILKRFKPCALIGFGSYHTIPVMASAALSGVPYMLYEANSIPGKAVKAFSSRAKLTAIQFSTAKIYLRGATTQVSMGSGYKDLSVDGLRMEALSYFNLKANKTTLLISGGSQGAEKINEVIYHSNLPDELQIIHLLGKKTEAEKFVKLYENKGINACVKQFEERMDLAWSAADLFLGRSGAGTIAELTQACVPSILIPYPFASENHQEINARFITDTLNAGTCILQKELTPGLLQDKLMDAIKKKEKWSLALKEYSEQNKFPCLEDIVHKFIESLQR